MSKLWVLSLDALGASDAVHFENLGGFQQVRETGVSVPHVRSVYPSLTYPAHASIVTGRTPHQHGIVNNRKRQPHREVQDWFWYEAAIRGDTLFRAAHRAGRSVAALLWPVAGRAPIAENLAEIFPTRRWQTQALCSLYAGNAWTTWRLDRKFGTLRQGILQPALDDFTEACAEELIRTKNPDLLFVHFVDVDAQKHHHGIHAAEVREAVERLNARVERFLARQARHSEPVDLVLLSDHSQIDTPHWIYPLDVFAKEGWLQRRGGKVTSYRAYPHAAGGACYVYAHPSSAQAHPDLKDFLKEFAQKEGLQADFSNAEADGEAVAILEAPAGTAFSDYFSDRPAAEEERATHLANHGYSPDKPDYDAVFFATGPSFQRGRSLSERGSLQDIAPTLAQVAGLSLRGAERRGWGETLLAKKTGGIDRGRKLQ